METTLIIVLGIITLASLVLSYIERKDFLDRLMSKDISEYKSLKEEPNQLDEEENQFIPILEAKEEILNGD